MSKMDFWHALDDYLITKQNEDRRVSSEVGTRALLPASVSTPLKRHGHCLIGSKLSETGPESGLRFHARHVIVRKGRCNLNDDVLCAPGVLTIFHILQVLGSNFEEQRAYRRSCSGRNPSEVDRVWMPNPDKRETR